MAEDEHSKEKTIEQDDREWLENVYRGTSDPQLTVRAVASGMLLGGIMSLSNLYIGLKSGWGLGVDIAAVILIFSIFKGLKSIGLVRREFGILENTIMMTAAVAASWISSAGLVSAVPALTMVTGKTFVWWHLMLWLAATLYLGLFMAIPLKRQMIQVEKLRFPAAIPTGETLKAMYSKGDQAIRKAKALAAAGGLGIVIAGLRDAVYWIPGLFNLPLSIIRLPLSRLTLSFEPSLIFIGIGALFGLKVGISMLLGLILNYGVLAPTLINAKVMGHPAPQIRAESVIEYPLTLEAGQFLSLELKEATETPLMEDGSSLQELTYVWQQDHRYETQSDLLRDLNSESLIAGGENPFYGVVSIRDTHDVTAGGVVLLLEASHATKWESELKISEAAPLNAAGVLGFPPGAARLQAVGGFRNIVNWSLWPGAAILVVGGLLALAFQWRTLGRTFGSMFRGLRKSESGPKGLLDHIEIPMTWFVPGFLITGILAIALQIALFSIYWYMGILAVLLTFFLSAVAARAGAEIGINPLGPLGKVTQLVYGVVHPGNMTTNLMTANITAGAAASCADTVANLKVGYMVGAHPRKQFIAQLFGVVSGALFSVPAYYILVPDVSVLGGSKFPAPSALVWAGVAKVLSQGLSTLPPSVILALEIAIALGVVIVIVDRIFPKLRPYTPSPAALGIAMMIPAYTSFSMFLGSLIAWILEKKVPEWNSMFTIPIASGMIAGESLAGVLIAALIVSGVL